MKEGEKDVERNVQEWCVTLWMNIVQHIFKENSCARRTQVAISFRTHLLHNLSVLLMRILQSTSL